MALEVNETMSYNPQLPRGFRVYRVRLLRACGDTYLYLALCSWPDGIGILSPNRFARPPLLEDQGVCPDTKGFCDHGYYRVRVVGL